MSIEFSTPSESSALTGLLQAEDANIKSPNSPISEKISSNINKVSNDLENNSNIHPLTVPTAVPSLPRNSLFCCRCHNTNVTNPEAVVNQSDRMESVDRPLHTLHTDNQLLFPHLQLGQGKRKRSPNKKRKSHSKPRKSSKISKKRKKTSKHSKKKVNRSIKKGRK